MNKSNNKQFSLKWTRFSYERPTKTGYYFMYCRTHNEIIYYDVKTDVILLFNYDYNYAEEWSASVLEDKMWAKMPRLPMTSILNYGSIEIC